jgi:hypothetical protein
VNAVTRGQADLIEALTACEREMIDYGFAAVQTSLLSRQRTFGKNRREVLIPGDRPHANAEERVLGPLNQAANAIGASRIARILANIVLSKPQRSLSLGGGTDLHTPMPTFRRERKAAVFIV